MNLKASRRKEIVKARAEINDIKPRKQHKKSIKPEAGFLKE